MANHECVIGMIYKDDYAELATLKDLKDHIEAKMELNKGFASNGYEWLCRKVWSIKEYCDKRKNTDLTRFDYCPYCGKKIEWKKIKEDSK